MGVTLGGMFANLIGGWVTDAFDWRTAFFVVGLPGLLIALIFKLTVREPPRGFTDPKGTKVVTPCRLGRLLKRFLKTGFWLMTAGATLPRFAVTEFLLFNPFFWFEPTGLPRERQPYGLTHP